MKIGNFPEVVDENSGRVVAGIITILTVCSIISFTIPALAYFLVSYLVVGFLLRFLYASKYEPVARIVQKYIVPTLKIPRNSVPGMPKRFAQFIGLLFSCAGLSFLFLQEQIWFSSVLSVLGFFAFLESSIGFCAGCWFFGILMKIGVVPQEVCEECNNINLRFKQQKTN